MTIWFSADMHCYHENIIKFCNRPFVNSMEMTETIIANHNRLVKPTDMVYWLGDIAWNMSPDIFEQLVKRFNGKKHLILGNHDNKKMIYKCKKELFTHISDVWELNYNRNLIFMSHYPHVSWPSSFHGSWMLHGHTHGKLVDRTDIKRLDVGVDVHKFCPISIEQVEQIMHNKIVSDKQL